MLGALRNLLVSFALGFGSLLGGRISVFGFSSSLLGPLFWLVDFRRVSAGIIIGSAFLPLLALVVVVHNFRYDFYEIMLIETLNVFVRLDVLA